ncbi:MAG: PQQ-binding-like beta-propeller repeat protein [Limisphaerales bacterium]
MTTTISKYLVRACLRIGLLAAGPAGLCLARIACATDGPPDALQFWPQWRGPLASGAAPLADPPLTWSETEHVKWKVRIPGYGTSTPIVWGDRVFILSAVSTGKKPARTGALTEASAAELPAPAPAPADAGKGPGPSVGPPDDLHQFLVLCYERQTGRLLWQRVAREEVPHEGHHPDNGYASASPVTDGRQVLAYFGSRGLHCYDMEGNLKWSKDFGRMKTKRGYGEGASPALYGNAVIIYWDDETDNDFITALDKETGRELWRTPRDEPTGWSTPLVVESGGKTQVIVNATRRVRSYDLATGKQIWECGGQTVNAIPSPVASADTVYVTSGFTGNALYAIALDRQGDLTGTDAIRWSHNKHTPYAPSPLLVDNFLYVVTLNNGALSCFDAPTGAVHFEGEKLEGISGIYASPVAARNRVYVLGRDGTCLVLEKGPQLKVLARNKVADKTDASLALVGKALFIRGHEYLYCAEE